MGTPRAGTVLWLIIGLGLALRLGLAWSSIESQDGMTFRVTAEILQAGGQLYLDTTGLFSYPPLWAAVSVAAYWLAEHTSLSGTFWIQIPIIVADSAIAYVLYLVVRARHGAANRAAALYALNPLPIVLCTWQQQIDAVVILFSLLAIYLYQRSRNLTLPALSLAVGIALKSYPILLLPIFLLHIDGLRKRAYFLLLVVVPALALFVPFLLSGAGIVVQEVMAYSGYTDQGWGMLWNQLLGALERRGIATEYLPPLISISKLAFVALYGIAIAIAFRHRERFASQDMFAQAAVVLTGFLVLYGAISSQYLLWALPFMIMLTPGYAIVYSISALSAILAFYWANCCIVVAPDALQRVARLVGSILPVAIPDHLPYRLWIATTAGWFAVTAIWWLRRLKLLATTSSGSLATAAPPDPAPAHLTHQPGARFLTTRAERAGEPR